MTIRQTLMLQAALASIMDADRAILAADKTWRCACGWAGKKDGLMPNASGCLCCPSCGGSGGLI